MALHPPSLDLSQIESPTPPPSVPLTIAAAFGPDGPGLLLVRGLSPSYTRDRRTLFDAARALATLPDDELRRLERPDLHFALGWSRGREKFKGAIDHYKASFYANPLLEGADTSHWQKYPHYAAPNVWPTHASCAHLRPSFLALSHYINAIALHVARHCDAYIRSVLPPDALFTALQPTLRDSRAAKGRLLHYYPTSEDSTAWCGFHNDHGTLTGLIPGELYPYHAPSPPDPPSSLPSSPSSSLTPPGLYVRRHGRADSELVALPPDALAFQLGEAAQVASGGVLRATPHMVRGGSSGSAHVARVAMALFLQPDPWAPLALGGLPHDTQRTAHALQTSTVVPSLGSRWSCGEDYDTFARRTMAAYCVMPAAGTAVSDSA